MSQTFTYDVFSSLDGYASTSEHWGGYWGKQGPELLARRLAIYSEPCLLILGAATYRLFAHFLATEPPDSEVFDPWVSAMLSQPMLVISTSLHEPLDLPNARLERGDATEVVARLREESSVPLRSHGSIRMNRALLNAGLVDIVQLTVFPALTGASGSDRIFAEVGDFDLELLDARLLDSRTQELSYRPTPHP
ncbi:dihydrofolate reductase family protein [Glutamicibacter sp. PS]|uniref:dihydrofolate reductase family protein n=1 Tax=Glutamicibacter sp. PS TaxID=3075634 RepID=UPI00284BAC6E|nr:dihydrofolate reductase family protein [Glutamicibacter sp. PS]MDR4534976.1 dihydrofolate reductase family protein [Glutamicibacter sp. PS]